MNDRTRKSQSLQRTEEVSRRRFLALGLGGVGAVTVCACGGVTVGGILIALSQKDEKAADIQLLQTSDANRRDIEKTMARPVIVPRADWGALPPNHEAEFESGFYSDTNLEGWRVYAEPLPEVYNTVVIHHSVIYEGDDVNTMLAVQNLHRERGWADVGYHYLIGKDGTIYEGREVGVRGTHVAGYNTGTVGVCLLGNFMEELPTPPQTHSAQTVVNWLAVYLQLNHLAGHRQFNSITLCPGDNLVSLLETLATGARLVVGTEGYTGPLPTEESDGTSFNGCCCCQL